MNNWVPLCVTAASVPVLCLCKSFSVLKHISGAGPHSFYNVLLTVLIFSTHLHSTIACIQGSSRAVQMAWISCPLFANRETETYSKFPWFYGNQCQGEKAAVGASIELYSSALSSGQPSPCHQM